jgi:transposase
MKSNGINENATAIDQARTIAATEGKLCPSEGERSEQERGQSLPSVARAINPEVLAQAARRRYRTEYKLNILEQFDNCKKPGDVGALLRREGLYSSHLTKWRRERQAGILAGLEPHKRGRKEQEVNPLTQEVARLQGENERLQARLKQAETIIEVQKKISQLLGISVPENEEKS